MSATARERAVVALDEALMELHARRDRRREQLEALWQADLRAEREVRRLLQRVLHYLSASGGSPLPPAAAGMARRPTGTVTNLAAYRGAHEGGEARAA